MSGRSAFPDRSGAPEIPPSGIPALPPGLIGAPPGSAGSPLSAPAQAASGALAPGPAGPLPAGAAPAAGSVPAGPVPQRARERAVNGIGPAFAGTAAGTGARIAAFTIDIIVLVAVTLVVLGSTGSAVVAGIAAFEVAVVYGVIEARTGLTPGNGLLRLRTSRAEGPYSPGIGRSFVRWLFTAAGLLLAVVGAWIVVASSAWDPSGRRRSWADRAASTVVVAVPPRRRAGNVVSAAAAPALAAPVLAAPQLVSTSVRVVAVDEHSSSSARTGAPLAGPQPVGPEAPARSRAVEPAGAPGALAEGGDLLLIFDTGQRARFPLPVAVNLGRSPVPSEHGDRVLAVDDPESTVSKTHLRLEHSRGRTWVTDTGSTNGTEIVSDDGAALLVPGERVLLDEADRVRIGNRAFTVSLLLASDGAAQGGAAHGGGRAS